MSSQRGNVKKKGPPKFQNTRAFKNNLHDKSNKIKLINSIETWGLCAPCKDVIDWKIKYKKYKPLSQPKTCVTCSQKTIKRAYYTVCQPCSERDKVCGKCGKQKDIVQKVGLTPEEEASRESQLEQELKALPERKRRAFLRNQAAGNYTDSGQGTSAAASVGDSDEEESDEEEEEAETNEDLNHEKLNELDIKDDL